ILHLLIKLVTEIGKKDFCVLAAVLSKALARSETNRTQFIELPLNRPAAHVTTEEAITAPFKPDLKWHRSVAGERHEIDCPAKCQRAVFECIGAPKDFRVADRGNVKILESSLAIPLVEVQAVHQKHYAEWLVFRRDSGSSN